MIYPKKNVLVHQFFNWYLKAITKRYFHAINHNNIHTDSNKSILLIANHFSWWDSLIMYYLNSRVFKRKFHFMVLEETVKELFFVKYMGGFSVNKGSRSVIQSLDFAAELLNDPANLVLIFPEGMLHSNFTKEVMFEKGIMRIIKKAEGKFQIVFAAAFVENLNQKKPAAYISFKKTSENFSRLSMLQQAYKDHYDEAKLQQGKIVL